MEIFNFICLWFIAAMFTAFIGIHRVIGFWKTFLISFLFSPLIGVIVACTSKSWEDVINERRIITLLEQIVKKDNESINKNK